MWQVLANEDPAAPAVKRTSLFQVLSRRQYQVCRPLFQADIVLNLIATVPNRLRALLSFSFQKCVAAVPGQQLGSSALRHCPRRWHSINSTVFNRLQPSLNLLSTFPQPLPQPSPNTSLLKCVCVQKNVDPCAWGERGRGAAG